MAEPLKKMIANRYRGHNLPVAVVLPDGGRLPLSAFPEIEVVARSWRGLKALASPGMGALAKAYVRGEIDFSGSARRILGIAESMVGQIARGEQPAVTARWRQLVHQRRSNRTNIQYHYDVSNAFYRMWLDQRMVYSCAYYRQDGDTLDQAQAQKLDHICRKLQLQPDESFLDIGCGWGGLIFWAAEHYGVRAKGITLSQNQFDHVQEQIRARNLGARVEVELLDYERLPDTPTYDKVASVGMFEHVGVARFPRYFGKIYRALKPGGLVLNHGITHNWPVGRSLGSGIGEFVEEYVFPGGELAHVSKVIEGLAHEQLELIDAEALREHYGKTLWHWVERLETNATAARAEVGEEKFRIWRIYLAGSAHAFDRGWLNLFQLLAGKPHADGRLPHPLTREYVYR
ncbi:MAG: class I SAM-dependent methyltransferase [Pseudomonadota bacterium]|nr:class I SAM-dependent methyltransferase [Pseudomonadota bacterium]